MKTNKWLLVPIAAALLAGCSDDENGIAPEPVQPEVRVLTFEDADYKGGENLAGERNWSSLIDAEYNGPLLYPAEQTLYRWSDENNTFLASMLPNNYGDYQYWGGGEALSNYVLEAFGTATYQNQLSVAYRHPETGFGGHNGSRNFCIHNGFVNNDTPSSLYFSDGKARVIDHLWVINTAYVLKSTLEGDGFNPAFGENDFLKIVATGHTADGQTRQAEFMLIQGTSAVMEWTRWELAGLGEIVKLEFDMQGSQNSEYGLNTPAYFAYDDIAVLF